MYDSCAFMITTKYKESIQKIEGPQEDRRRIVSEMCCFEGAKDIKKTCGEPQSYDVKSMVYTVVKTLGQVQPHVQHDGVDESGTSVKHEDGEVQTNC